LNRLTYSVFILGLAAGCLAVSASAQSTTETPLAVAPQTQTAENITPQTQENAPASADPRGNVRIGSATFRVVTGVSTQYNDNINYSEFSPLSDFIISPNIEFNILWPITEINTLTFDLGLSYDKYLNHPEADSNNIVIAPDSALNFRVSVGKHVTINFFDRFSYQQTPLDSPTVGNTLDYGRFKNDLGYLATWRVNKVLELDHGYHWTKLLHTSEQFRYLDRDTHNLTHTVRFHVNPALQTGVLSIVSISDYDQNFQNDNAILQVGPFVRAKIGENTEVSGQVTYVMGLFDDPTRTPGKSNFDSNDLQSVNALGSITNRTNQYISQRLTAGYETRLGTNSNYYEIAYTNYSLDWQLMSHLSLNTSAFYEYGTESGSLFSENFHRFGGSVGLNYRTSKSTVTGLRYDYIEKDSDRFGRDYSQNRITLDFQYRF
jgi:hypothetical protein